MTIAEKLRYNSMRIKFFISRTIGYASILTSGMILYLFLEKLNERGHLSFNPEAYTIPLFIIGFILLIIIGWIEVDLIKAQGEEARVAFEKNPLLMEMRESIINIEKKLQ